MVQRELLEYVFSSFKRGFSPEQIRLNLLAQGKSDYDIHEAMKAYESGLNLSSRENKIYSSSFFHSMLFKIILSTIIFIILGLLIFLLLSEKEPYFVRDFSSNTSLELSKENVKVKVGEEKKIMTFSKDGKGLKYSFEGVEGSLLIDEEVKFDLDGDGELDFFVRYDSLKQGDIPILFFGAYIYCTSEWECSSWRDCVNGIQKRICIDKNSCNFSKERPDLQMDCVIEVENDEEEDEMNESEEIGEESFSFSSPEEACNSFNESVYYFNDSFECYSSLPSDRFFEINYEGANITCCRGKLISTSEELCEVKSKYYFNESHYCPISILIGYNGLSAECCNTPVSLKYEFTSELNEIYNSINLSGNCSSEFGSFLEFCNPYKCFYVHPIVGGNYNSSVVFEEDNFCYTYEEMPNGGYSLCKYNSTNRVRAADYWKEYYSNENISDISFPSEMLDQGICQILGYD